MKLMENFKKRRNSHFSIAVDPKSKYASYVIIKLQYGKAPGLNHQ